MLPNAFGLYDMYGNVSEWCADWVSMDYYARSPENDPAGPVSGTHRVTRSGGWAHWPIRMRSANRDLLSPHQVTYLLGFRLPASIAPSSPATAEFNKE